MSPGTQKKIKILTSSRIKDKFSSKNIRMKVPTTKTLKEAKIRQCPQTRKILLQLLVIAVSKRRKLILNQMMATSLRQMKTI
jgi:hypothetical protein